MKKKLLIFVILLLVLLLGYFAYQKFFSVNKKITQKGLGPIIGFSLATLKEERWQRDQKFFTEEAEKLGATVNAVSADADANVQKSQIEALILQNVSVLVIVPQDEKVIAPLIEKAHQKGIKVIAYDRLISNSDLDGYVTADYVKAGEQQAQAVLDAAKKGNFAIVMGAADDSTVYQQKQGIMNVLQPEIAKGNVNIIYQGFTTDWKPEVAYANVKQLLTANPKIDGIVDMNDGTAYGVIQALKEKGLAGKVPISGMDAELAGCQRIVEGIQTQTVYIPIYLQAYKAADVAVALAQGQSVTPDGSTDNGQKKVPTYLVQPISVNKDNMMTTVIKDGFHTYDEVYQNVPQDKRPQR